MRAHPLLTILSLLAASTAAAQSPDTVPAYATPTTRLGLPSGEDESRLRTLQVLGRAPVAGTLIRSHSSRAAPLPGDRTRLRAVGLAPELHAVWNSDLATSLNQGALWAGRGLSTQLSFGGRIDYGPLSLIVAPSITHSENRRVPTLPLGLQEPRPHRSTYASPWYVQDTSIDLPYRMGRRAYSRLDPGQSTLAVRLPTVVVGLSTESQWWGPAVRNAIVMSANAPGFPHGFLRTSRPLNTPAGPVEAKWIVGGLTESPHFDDDPANDLRWLSGAAITLSPRWEPNLTLGLARTVYGSAEGRGDVLRHAGAVLTRWDDRIVPGEPPPGASSDQLLSVFGRWVLPGDGSEVYFEWARQELPSSLRDIFATPSHSQGYTLGLQWAHPTGPGIVRLQAELTNLAKSATIKHRPVDTYYTGRATAQGYTHLGRVLGAAIGPGSVGHWVALDYLRPGWRVGASLNRVVWEADALYLSRSPVPERVTRSFHARDVSLLGGLHTAARLGPLDARLDLVLEKRYNYLFQNPDVGYEATGAVDLWNRQLELTLTPTRR